jgi:RsiW-degrading membrane proteinase PrsW (M82 family)
VRLIIVLAAIVPPLLVVSYGIAKARANWRCEAVWNAFFLGALSALAAVAIEFVIGRLLAVDHMHPLPNAAARSIFVVAIPEEAIKFLVLIALAEKHVDVRRLQDILVLAVAVSLGFATLENFLYVISPGNWQTVAALRAITSVPGHGIDGLAMGTLLMAARLHRDRPSLLAAALVVPVVLHAAYDFPLFAVAKGAERDLLVAIWLLVLTCSSIFAIMLCNHVLVKARATDCALGHDGSSTDGTDRLIFGGVAALFAGPALAALAFYAKGSEATAATAVLSVLPIALGIDAICTGLEQKRRRGDERFELYSRRDMNG